MYSCLQLIGGTEVGIYLFVFNAPQRKYLPVRATSRGKHRRLARTISSMGSNPVHGVKRPQYKNSSTPRIHAVLVLGIDT